ncbi:MULTISPECIES: adenosylcobinamide-GDP ribazoletransferase [Terrisporobacter]|uniref:Adenosylcobinamide-GDP ribazoletransferase n=1 Tax=Terrisporobacter muris TaxID=2963284 RepID=A0A9X2S0W0_9FIRM|nr:MULTISPECIES: adenosylcobinamide-GDP ribazoletransferase [Terrisporobacter]MCC3670423.1 adenosylcobinamide-GDP ribazoletransferase [Terrisporobacter mayombei]MCR1822388.1 adenosylcobinamide-GDP ribazoletransferase [Terrisporobacter muris]MDU6984780.1 adenosylcobinamide-GDP ribazoletransferase [Terrisporobacter othiniensis]MDY3375329.1 adenosylcobinamide-GDP ribazoletransferase [Terrisporobacter othiniensis]
MKRFIGLLQFMTRIPIKADIGFDEEFHKSIVYFPLVGFVIGLISFFIGSLAIRIFDPFITSILIVAGEVILTGGLHIDGLGDTFDAIYSNRDKDRMLEIMKDSRLGTNSLLAILFLVLIKIGLLNSAINSNLMYLIIFMPMISRLGVIIMLYKTVTPRKVGMGNIFIGKATLGMFITAIVYTIVIIVAISKFIFLSTDFNIIILLLSIVVVMIFDYLFKNHIYKKIDGVTGDILGCTIELGELIFLLFSYIVILI